MARSSGGFKLGLRLQHMPMSALVEESVMSTQIMVSCIGGVGIL
jgi:hypothetical protein